MYWTKIYSGVIDKKQAIFLTFDTSEILKKIFLKVLDYVMIKFLFS
jgi:hypothetical protein